MSGIVNRVADGRRLATRRVVMNSPASIPCIMYRKTTLYANPVSAEEPVDELSFEALSLSKQDEPEYKYDDLGTAWLLMDKFNGGVIHKNNSMINPSDITILAQLEPYDLEQPTPHAQISNIPAWLPQEGDLVGAMIYGETIIWFEVTGISGQTLMSDFGKKYMLNRRDDLPMSPFEEERELRIAMKFLPQFLSYIRGGSANWNILVFDENSPIHQGIFLDADTVVTAQIIDASGQVLTVPTVIPAADQNEYRGYINLRIDSDTSNWPLGETKARLTVTRDNAVIQTTDLFFRVEEN